jgi:hypothetical protein
MHHTCGPTCECRIDLNKAAAGLAEASRLLSESIFAGPDELIETYYAFFRAAKSKFCGARAAYLDHQSEPALGSGLGPGLGASALH